MRQEIFRDNQQDIPNGKGDRPQERGGREIKGLEPKVERFSRLQEGSDYRIVGLNDNIESQNDPRDFVFFVNPTGGEISLTIFPPSPPIGKC